MVKMFFILFGVLAFCQAVCGQSVSKVWVADRKDGTYMNPVLHADYSDPDVCAVGDDFYMTASSFNYVPGLRMYAGAAYSPFQGFGELETGKLRVENYRTGRIL